MPFFTFLNGNNPSDVSDDSNTSLPPFLVEQHRNSATTAIYVFLRKGFPTYKTSKYYQASTEEKEKIIADNTAKGVTKAHNYIIETLSGERLINCFATIDAWRDFYSLPYKTDYNHIAELTKKGFTDLESIMHFDAMLIEFSFNPTLFSLTPSKRFTQGNNADYLKTTHNYIDTEYNLKKIPNVSWLKPLQDDRKSFFHLFVPDITRSIEKYLNFQATLNIVAIYRVPSTPVPTNIAEVLPLEKIFDGTLQQLTNAIEANNPSIQETNRLAPK